MKYVKKRSLIFTGLMFSSYVLAFGHNINSDSNMCLDSKSCPKLLEISLVNLIKKEKVIMNNTLNDISLQSIEIAFPLLIKNKSKKSLTTNIIANHDNNKVNCGTFNVPAKSSVTEDISCNVGGVPYSLSDSDGRSNVINISSSTSPDPDPDPQEESCAGKSAGDE